MSEIIEASVTIDGSNSGIKASQLLAVQTGLSQATIKDAMQKGAVWLCKGKKKQRIRRATKVLKVGDTLEINYNEDILCQTVPEPMLVHDALEYSVWFKPYGLSCQGSRWGDFASINRWVEVNIARLTEGKERPVFLVHRLDRATTGLILLCHTKGSAQAFSEMFRLGRIEKCYQAIVHGDCSSFPLNYEVNKAVDGKAAKSIFSFVKMKDGFSLLDVRLLTGRKHQIRAHLSSIGYPIVGDRLYGQGQEERDLQLQSVSLSFKCPVSHELQRFEVADRDRLVL